jgi:hypothetical protein
MSYMGGNRRARVDRNAPEAWAICDRCGQLRNHSDLAPQMAYRGNSLQSTGQLVCPPCLDEPHPHDRPVFLTQDPEPVPNARPPQWPSQMGPVPADLPVQQIIEGDDDE